MRNADNPAMPHTEYDAHGNMPKGLSKREYIAAMAMQGILASESVAMHFKSNEDLALQAVLQADALLIELERPS